MLTSKEKSDTQTIADDAHPGRRHLSVHDDAVRGGARIECSRARRGAGGRQENLSGDAARCVVDEPRPDEIYSVGTVANIVQSLKLPDGNIKVLVEGVERGKIVSVSEDEGFFRAVVKTFQLSRWSRARNWMR